MKGYVIWLFVALACSSMADDTEQLKSQLDEIHKDIQIKKEEIKRNELNRKHLRGVQDDFDNTISKMQKELLSDRLEIAKTNVRLDRKKLEVGQCLNPQKYTVGVPVIAKERADEIVEKLESAARETLTERYLSLLQHRLFRSDNLFE